MKILRYILLASLTCALSACEKDEILPEPEPPVVTPGDDPGKDEEEKIRLGITASFVAGDADKRNHRGIPAGT